MTPLEILSQQFRPFEPPTSAPQSGVPSCGVYLLIDGADIVYVGSSASLETRSYSHVCDKEHERVGWKRFDRVLWYPLPEAVHCHYEGAFIRALRPKYNLRAPKHHGYDNEILEGFRLPVHADEVENAVDWSAEVAARLEERAPTPEDAVIARNIKHYRLAAGLTKSELARAVGVGKQSATLWESGRCAPTRKRMPAVASALGVSVSALTSPAVSS